MTPTLCPDCGGDCETWFERLVDLTQTAMPCLRCGDLTSQPQWLRAYGEVCDHCHYDVTVGRKR